MMTHVVHKKSKRTRVIAIVAAVILLIGGGVTFALWPKDPAKIIAELDNDPRKIRQAVEDGRLTREQGFDAMRERFEAEETKRLADYFALPTEKERDKYLDKMIDEMQSRRREWEQRRPTTQPTTRPERDRPTTRPSDAERNRRAAMRDDNTPPAQRAKRAEFRAAMMRRMQERGMTPGRGGWGGWGGGGGRGGGGGGRGGGGGGGR